MHYALRCLLLDPLALLALGGCGALTIAAIVVLAATSSRNRRSIEKRLDRIDRALGLQAYEE